MGKDLLIEILKSQLEAANATNIHLTATMKSMEANFNATIADLRRAIENLESLLKEHDENLDKAKVQMRGLKATFLPKQSEKQTRAATPKTDEEKTAEEQERKDKIKARGNNGAKRKNYFAIKEISEDVYPQDINVNITHGI